MPLYKIWNAQHRVENLMKELFSESGEEDQAFRCDFSFILPNIQSVQASEA